MRISNFNFNFNFTVLILKYNIMKKLLLVATITVAGFASAKGNVENSLKVKKNVEWCGTVTYVTSCGLPIQDSYCTSWGEACLMESAALLDEYFCG